MFIFKKSKSNRKQSDISIEKQITTQLTQIAKTPVKTLTGSEYDKIRKDEEEFLDNHYNFNSIESVEAIPVSRDLPDCAENGVTGELFYRLKQKAYEHEEAGRLELAIVCFKKSIQLAKLKHTANTINELEYSFIALLARNGYVDQATAEKEKADKDYILAIKNEDANHIRSKIKIAVDLGTDLISIDVHAHASPEMAKYQGRVYSLSGHSKKFPQLPDYILKTGELKNGEFVSVSYYIDGTTTQDMDYIKLCNPIKKQKYLKNIVAFSNRPFVDDRTEDYKAETYAIMDRWQKEAFQREQNKANIINIESERGVNKRNYKWLQENMPAKAPKSYSGYMRMKKERTKNFLLLEQLAKEKGKTL